MALFIRQNICTAKEDDLPFVASLWQDAQSNASLLGIENYTWSVIERDLDKNTRSYFVCYDFYQDSTLKKFLRWTTWLQGYYAVGPHTYNGCTEISVGLKRYTKAESKKAFLELCYASYYRRIAEFYPDFTTCYIDSPKEVI